MKLAIVGAATYVNWPDETADWPSEFVTVSVTGNHSPVETTAGAAVYAASAPGVWIRIGPSASGPTMSD